MPDRTMKSIWTQEALLLELGERMLTSRALRGQCRKCRVMSITRAEPEHEGANWRVESVNSHCRGQCVDVLKMAARELQKSVDLDWDLPAEG